MCALTTLDQRRSQLVFKHVMGVKEEEKDGGKAYGRVAVAAPTLIRRAGLMQALAFFEAKGASSGEQDDASESRKPFCALVHHWLEELLALERLPSEVRSLRARAEVCELVDYMRLTREVLALAQWHRRFAQSVLKVEPSEEMV